MRKKLIGFGVLLVVLICISNMTYDIAEVNAADDNEYKVTFKSDGEFVAGHSIEYNEEYYVAGGATFEGEAPHIHEIMDGIYVEYYTTDKSDKQYVYNFDEYKITEDTVFKAHWRKAIEVVYDGNGGKVQEGPNWQSSWKYLLLDNSRVCPDGAEYEGYEFVKWQIIDASGNVIGECPKETFYTVHQDVTFKAIWKKKSSESSNSDETQNKMTSTNTTKKTTTTPKTTASYSNEWVNGKWYNKDGSQTYKGTMSWKKNAKGWWIEDSAGWYPVSQWQKIDGKWYYFNASGYMESSCYRDGCWLGSDGAWNTSYSGGKWMSNATGWWFEDASGWYPVSQWVEINGTWYYFKADGYMATSQYIGGYWVDANGACQ